MAKPVAGNRAWMRWVLWLAAIYNIAWGGWVILQPDAMFTSVGLEPARYPMIWQCVGMIVGTYGVGYAIAATNPLHWWPLVLVGLIGKLAGPIGFLQAATKGDLPWGFGWTIITNDLIWWLPFALILWRAAQRETGAAPAP